MTISRAPLPFFYATVPSFQRCLLLFFEVPSCTATSDYRPTRSFTSSVTRESTSLEMSSKELPPAAEKIRCEIKAMIPGLSGRSTRESAEVSENVRGNIFYAGDSLSKKVESLSRMLSISNLRVCVAIEFHRCGM